mmetsp:Transcript_19183/g.40203  ORF Transcript_19183/g.40203 Transcript_19183/m.40203 type:complete len:738 (-) Transcript_19183:540-2753(-)
MAGDADALLKGMLGIGIYSSTSSGAASSAGAPPPPSSQTTTKSKGEKTYNDDNIITNATSSSGKSKNSNNSRVRPRPASQGKLRSDPSGDHGGATAAAIATNSSKHNAISPREPKSRSNNNNSGSNKKNQKKGNYKKEYFSKNSKEGKPINTGNGTGSCSSNVNEGGKPMSDSFKRNAKNYAWSAFQSSPDPSALPMPMFGSVLSAGDTDENDKARSEEIKDQDSISDLDNEKFATRSDSAVTIFKDGGGDSANNTSSEIRTSLVASMVKKTAFGSAVVSEGKSEEVAALLQRLGGGSGGGNTDDKNMRTAESLEAEFLSPAKSENDVREQAKGKEKMEQEETNSTALSGVNLLDALASPPRLHAPAPAEMPTDCFSVNEKNESLGSSSKVASGSKEGKSIESKSTATPISIPNDPQTETAEYPDLISQLMNPGGAAYGVQQQLQQYPPYPASMPHHPPLHYGAPPPPPGQHPNHHHHPHQHPYQNHPPPPHGGGYPYPPLPPPQFPHHPHQHPHHRQHPHHPSHQIHPQPPGYTTIQVRVPPALLPGRTMLVNGMQVPVPDGIPPGAIIPVTVPIHILQQGHPSHGPPPPPPPPPPHPHGRFGGGPPPHPPGGEYFGQQPHPNPMMMGHGPGQGGQHHPQVGAQLESRQQQHHQLQQGHAMQSQQMKPTGGSWAAKVASDPIPYDAGGKTKGSKDAEEVHAGTKNNGKNDYEEMKPKEMKETKPMATLDAKGGAKY